MIFFLYIFSMDVITLQKKDMKPIGEVPVFKKDMQFKNWTNHAMAERIRANNGYDTLKILALRVEFVEDDDTLTTGNGKMDMKGYGRPRDGLFYDPPHTKLYFEKEMEALKNFYYCASGGKLVIEYDVKPDGFFDSYQLPHEMKFYGDTSNYNRGLVRLMQDAIRKADQDETIDFSQYDGVVIFHAGSNLQTDIKRNSPFDIPSATVTSDAIEYYLGKGYIEADNGNARISVASVVPESPRQDGFIVSVNGVLFHEFGHILGLIDLYDVYYYTPGMGFWDLMGAGPWLGYPSGSLPSFPGAWDRVYLGWEEPLVITEDTTVNLYAMERDSSRFYIGDSLHPTVLKIPINDKEYFLIEVRATDIKDKDTVRVNVENGVAVSIDNAEYDFMLPGSGVLIWHIDDNIVEQYAPMNSVNTALLPHFGVDLEEADGIQDFEVLYNGGEYAYGSKYDPFFKSGINYKFTPQTDPNSNSYYGKTGINVEVLSEPDTVMKVKISFEGIEHNFPAKLDSGQFYYNPTFYDLDKDGKKEIIIPASYGVYFMRSNGKSFVNVANPINVSDSLNKRIGIGKLDADDIPDIVVVNRQGRIDVYNYDKNSNLIVKKNGFSYQTGEKTYSYPMLNDCDGDGIDELYLTTYYGDFLKIKFIASDSVVVDTLKTDGYFLSGPSLFNDSLVVALSSDNELWMFNVKKMEVVKDFPVKAGEGSNFAYIPPIVVNTGKKNIITVPGSNSNYKIATFDSTGTITYSWDTKEVKVTAPMIGDIDRDGNYDIVIGTANKLYGISSYGALLPEFPVKEDETYSRTTIVDILGSLYLVTINDEFYFTTPPLVIDTTLLIGSPDWGINQYRGGKLDTTFATYGIPLCLGADNIDDDADIEVVSVTDCGELYLWKFKGDNFYSLSDSKNRNIINFEEENEPQTPNRKLFVYPNPVRKEGGYIRFWTGDGGRYSLYVFDISGQLLDRVDIETEPDRWRDVRIVVDNYATGVYIVKLENSKERIFYKFGVLK